MYVLNNKLHSNLNTFVLSLHPLGFTLDLFQTCHTCGQTFNIIIFTQDKCMQRAIDKVATVIAIIFDDKKTFYQTSFSHTSHPTRVSSLNSDLSQFTYLCIRRDSMMSSHAHLLFINEGILSRFYIIYAMHKIIF